MKHFRFLVKETKLNLRNGYLLGINRKQNTNKELYRQSGIMNRDHN